MDPHSGEELECHAPHVGWGGGVGTGDSRFTWCSLEVTLHSQNNAGNLISALEASMKRDLDVSLQRKVLEPILHIFDPPLATGGFFGVSVASLVSSDGCEW